MKTDLITQFNLPKYLKGKSMAEASKAIDMKFKDRNDEVSLRTKDELLGRLSEAQEYIKMQQSLQNNSRQVPDMMNGQVPQGMEQFGDGGMITPGKQSQLTAIDGGIQPNTELMQKPEISEGIGGAEGIGGGAGGYANLATSAFDLGKTAFAKPTTDISGGMHHEKVDVAGGTMAGAAKGAKAGMMFGPWGAAVGGVVGGAAGFIGGKKEEAAVDVANSRYTQKLNAGYRQSDFAYGGNMTNKYDGKQPFPSFLTQNQPPQNVVDNSQEEMGINVASENMRLPDNRFTPQFNNEGQLQDTDEQSTLGKVAEWGKENYGGLMRLAPVVGNALALKNLKQAPKPTRDRLGSRYKTDMVDEKALQNQANQYNVNKAIFETSGGDLGAARTNILAANLNKTKALSSSYLKAEDANRGESTRAQQFNSQIDKINLGQSNLDEADSQANAGAYNTAKSQLQQAIAGDVGNIGKEHEDRRIVEKMFGYKWNGNYYVNKAGKKVSKEDADKQLESSKNLNKHGGYLKR